MVGFCQGIDNVTDSVGRPVGVRHDRWKYLEGFMQAYARWISANSLVRV